MAGVLDDLTMLPARECVCALSMDFIAVSCLVFLRIGSAAQPARPAARG